MTLSDSTSPSLQQLICSNKFGSFFGVTRETLDKVWSRLTDPSRNSVIYISMEIGADPDVYNPVRDFLVENDLTFSSDPALQSLLDKYIQGPQKIPNYSGGLGILAGDTLKSLADTHVPVAGISLLYREGYFSQLVDFKVGQIDHATFWKPAVTPTLFPLHEPGQPGTPLEISVPFFNGSEKETEINARVWVKLETSGSMDYFVPEFLLDYNLPSAPEWAREASKQLYSAKSNIIKANQRRLLGSGVLPLMQKLGLTARTIHLNEQHGVVVTLHLMLREIKARLGSDYAELLTDKDIKDIADKVAEQLVYTIHTPVKAGHDRFARSLYDQISGKVDRKILNLLANDEDSPDEYNFTALAMQVNRTVNSVSRLHRDVTRRQFPRFADKINAITNGVHLTTWASKNRSRVFDSSQLLNGWRDDPGVFSHARLHTDSGFRQQLLTAWQEDNRKLTEHINNMLIQHRIQMAETWIEPPNYLSYLKDDGFLEPGVFTIGFARRFSTYKRADLIFDDIDALAELLVAGNWRVNFIFAGKAHPSDEPGKSVLKLILNNQEELFTKSKGMARLVFIPGYDMAIAKMMVSGCHAWLNSPKRPLEASGTSGMKAAMNGVPNVSVMDGWWVEGYHNGKTGWKFGYEGPVAEADMSETPDSLLYEEDSLSFYQLFPEVLRTFYAQPDQFLDIAINNLHLNVPIFNTHRMVAEYVRKYELQLDRETEERLERFRKLYQSEM
ncbi:MAG: alpha-glucan family phosphorylase [Desulfobulbaceae bacterium]|nr:alpha-glucan family phosphorylase [Desulfobulbaceae bacterium]